MLCVGVIFDESLRPETTGGYVLRAMQSLVQAVHIRPEELDTVDPGAFDFFVRVDDGLDYVIPDRLRPLAWWAIDTHLSFDRCLQVATQADLVFAAQKNGAAQMQQAGIRNPLWLPLACEPEIHGRRMVENRFDVAFIGHFFPGVREDLLQRIEQEFSRSFIGQCDYRQMAEIYSASKIVFNRSLRDDINMRVFEGLCSGSLLMTNALVENGQDELFQMGLHAETYQDTGDLIDKIHYYLRHDQERERIAAAGQELARSHHTYRHRVETILTQLTSLTARTSIRQVGMPAGPQPVVKAPAYFEFDRPDVLERIPIHAQRLLDIGCGGGKLGVAIKQRQQAHVTGIELNSDAASLATTRLDEVYIGNVQAEGLDFPEGSFDCVICADVLEHLRDPAAVLKKIRRWLTPDGTLVTSIPNVRNHTVIRSLLAGNWTYESAGLLDEDHVRFFTRREVEKLLFRCGFEIRSLQFVGGPGFAEWQQQGKPRQITLGPFSLQVSTEAEAAEFFAYQFLTTAIPTPERRPLLTSIILVTYNQLPHTQACLNSIRLVTDEPYEIIVVDNGSTDGTVDFLRADLHLRLIENGCNRGFPAAANQGIQAAQGEQILLLNNDTIVTTGWLQRLTAALNSAPEVGLVGPVTNCISGEQQVPVTYDELAQLDGFAWDWGKQHHQHYQPTDRLVGFCLLIKKEVVDRIGRLDERFGIGNFEDDDYCRRAQAAGYQSLIATDTFIHHVGSATFRGSGTDLRGLLETNQQRYREKWDRAQQPQPGRRPQRVGCPHFLLEANDAGELLLQPNPIKLSACLIVRDNEQTIRPCLESLGPWVDELIVVDTGSQDRTPQICEELGATVHHWAWQDSFSLARNESFRHARGEWIFWMDSDDTIPEHCGQKLKQLVDGEHPEQVLGYVMQVHCPGINPHDVTAVDHVKLIRNRPDLDWEFHIHEQILPAIRRAGGDVAWTDIYVVHSGSDHSEAGHVRKLERDFKLLHRDLAERPDHPFVLFNLGMTYADAGQHDQAIQFLNRCIHVSGPEESHLRKAYALLIGSLMQLNKVEEAFACCTQSLRLFPGDKELLFRQAMLYHKQGHLRDAEQTYLRILQEQTDRHFASVDLGIRDYKARHNLAIVYEDMGRHEIAHQVWNDIAMKAADYEPAQRALTKYSTQFQNN
ncbi:glycosyltransferase [Planctomicrobium sp. SH527]|uniref:glycosyltransferase n=1 Tax=Planctomicrobium sp. SH527 TaxID=3448123 RepID=UPI003F5B8F4C